MPPTSKTAADAIAGVDSAAAIPWRSPYLITLKHALRRWVQFLVERKRRHVFVTRSRTKSYKFLANELAIYYFVRKCFFRFVGKMRKGMSISRGWRAATIRMNVRFKEKFSDIVTLRKKQRLYFQYWHLSHKIDRGKMKVIIRTFVQMSRLSKLVRSFMLRCLRTALVRWRRRSRWPLVESYYRGY